MVRVISKKNKISFSRQTFLIFKPREVIFFKTVYLPKSSTNCIFDTVVNDISAIDWEELNRSQVNLGPPWLCSSVSSLETGAADVVGFLLGFSHLPTLLCAHLNPDSQYLQLFHQWAEITRSGSESAATRATFNKDRSG